MIRINSLGKKISTSMTIEIRSLSIGQGLTCVVGENGSGKTTLLRLILNLIRPDNGQIEIGNIDISKSESWKSFTASYLAEDSLIPFLTPAEYISLIENLFHVKYSDLIDTVSEISDFMNDTIMNSAKVIGKLSTGQKKILGIVAALLKQPKLLVLDEPFSNLDIGKCHELIDIFNKYKTNSTIIITSHNLDIVADISDSFIIMNNGKVVSNFLKSNYSSVDELKEELTTKIIHRQFSDLS